MSVLVKFEFTRYKSEEEPERTDYKCDRKYQYELVGEKLRALYWSGWHVGTIKYYNVDFKEYSVTFEDGSDDYISREDILNGKDVILEPSERSSKISALVGIKREAQGQITDSFRAAKTPKVIIISIYLFNIHAISNCVISSFAGTNFLIFFIFWYTNTICIDG